MNELTVRPDAIDLPPTSSISIAISRASNQADDPNLLGAPSLPAPAATEKEDTTTD